MYWTWGGNLPNEDHCLFMRAKLRNFSREDAVAFAHDNGMQRPDAIIREVADVLKPFRPIVEKNNVGARWIGRVESTIFGHLKSWGEYDKPTVFLPSEAMTTRFLISESNRLIGATIIC